MKKPREREEGHGVRETEDRHPGASAKLHWSAVAYVTPQSKKNHPAEPSQPPGFREGTNELSWVLVRLITKQ